MFIHQFLLIATKKSSWLGTIGAILGSRNPCQGNPHLVGIGTSREGDPGAISLYETGAIAVPTAKG